MIDVVYSQLPEICTVKTLQADVLARLCARTTVAAYLVMKSGRVSVPYSAVATLWLCSHTLLTELADFSWPYIWSRNATQIILTWYREHRDQLGGFSRKRLSHCTSVGLAPAITPNVGNSGTQFISVGVCVRANPFNNIIIIQTV